MNSSFFDALKKVITKDRLILFILFGILLIIISIPHDKKEKTVTDSQSTQTQLAEILSEIQGVGKCSVMVNYKSGKDKTFSEKENEVVGVLIVAEGADRPAITEKIMSSVKALLGISANKIVIMKMED